MARKKAGYHQCRSRLSADHDIEAQVGRLLRAEKMSVELMLERSWPGLPIGRIELTSYHRNEMREIGRRRNRPRSQFSG